MLPDFILRCVIFPAKNVTVDTISARTTTHLFVFIVALLVMDKWNYITN